MLFRHINDTMKVSSTLAMVLTFLLGISSAAPVKFDDPVRIKADQNFIDTEIGHAAPFVGDFNGDGLKDLLVGQFGDGHLWIFLNEGSNKEPVLAAGTLFQNGRPEGTVPTG